MESSTTISASRTGTIRGLPRPLARAMEAYADRLDVDAVTEAYRLAEGAHAGQKRASGEDFVSHAVEVATILAQLRLDSASLVAGLIHDVVEDTALTLEDVEERFGKQIRLIVNGMTKIGKVRYRSNTEHQVENYRKLLLSMAEDARVILIKLADRLHNMRTLEHLPPEKRRRIALETREIYAPLAHRLGIASIKWELEDLAFKFIEPEAYADLRKKVQQRRRERERQILEMQRPLEDALREAEIPFQVTGRPKHLWSIYKKMSTRDLPYEEIYDLMAIRVITDSVQNCYAALGVIHSRWTPFTDRFHDYVATPKSNMYRSLHTTVFGPGGRRYEIQIRTGEMHRTAEYGIAAHWRYKEGKEATAATGASGATAGATSAAGGAAGSGARAGGGGSAPRSGKSRGDDEVDEALTWFRQVLEWQQETKEPEEFMEFLRMDLFQGEIFVFTPKGDVKQLPTGATPIDFAYSVHTEVGFHCAGAKVNGRIAPLSRELKNGDTVEVLTDPNQTPSRDWLAFVKTSRARQRIRHWIRTEEFESAVRLGRDILEREVRKQRLGKATNDQYEKAAETLEFEDFDHVCAAVGRGELGPAIVTRALYPEHDASTSSDRGPSTLERIARKIRRSPDGVRIQGMDNLMVKYAQCCQPVPGDRVIGYITRGRGVSIHRSDCPNVLDLDRERRVEIEWSAEDGDRFYVRLFVRGTDRRGLLSEMARAISDTGTDITHAETRAEQGGMIGEFAVEVRDLSHLKKVMTAVGRVKGVLSVERGESFLESDLVEASK